jgi:hypothetical protein
LARLHRVSPRLKLKAFLDPKWLCADVCENKKPDASNGILH